MITSKPAKLGPVHRMMVMRRTWCSITRQPKTVEYIYYRYRSLWYEALKLGYTEEQLK